MAQGRRNACTPASSSGSHDIVLAGDGDDTVFASAGRDIVLGEDGSDDLIGNGGNDVIEAGHTDDVAFGGPGNDVVVGDDGNDVLYGNFGSDTVVGADGNDYINGDNPQPPPPGPLNPAINPAPNNDACSGGPGLDTVANRERGGDGSDPGGPSAPPPPPHPSCRSSTRPHTPAPKGAWTALVQALSFRPSPARRTRPPVRRQSARRRLPAQAPLPWAWSGRVNQA